MTELSKLKKRIGEIEKRNIRVETDKAWETSVARRILLIVFTYLSIAVYLTVIEVSRPWLNAIVPSIGFLLSTLTLPWFKQIWLEYRKK